MNLYPTDHTSLSLEEVYCSIRDNGFSEYTLQLIDSYTNYILNGKTNLTQFNQQEHAGLCLAGEMLIGAYIVCNYARASLEAGRNAAAGEVGPANWEMRVWWNVAKKGFTDNRDGNGVNYIGQRLYLEDMHPANVFVDVISDTPICIDCIVKFI